MRQWFQSRGNGLNGIFDKIEEVLDQAMVVNNGGIDFTANQAPLEVRNAGEAIKFHLDPVQLAQLQNATGFVPVIISIEPLNDLKSFLGVPSKISVSV